jgi:hypothetical protein
VLHEETNITFWRTLLISLKVTIFPESFYPKSDETVSKAAIYIEYPEARAIVP